MSGFRTIRRGKFYDWRERYRKVNEHSGWVPRDFWLEGWEKQAIIGFLRLNSAVGCITPKDMLARRRQEIHAERDRKLEEARKQRQVRRQNAT